LFHAIVTAVADDLVGATHRHTPRYRLAFRAVDHSQIRQLCDDIVKTTLPAKYRDYEPRGGFGNEIETAAAAFNDLQESRHASDYDPAYRASLSEATSSIALARSAIAALSRVNAAKRKAFTALIAFPPRRPS
jgi:hypothetical protein